MPLTAGGVGGPWPTDASPWGRRFMKVATALENWRAAEKTLAAIEARIDTLGRRDDLSAEDERQLAALRRARESASTRADKCWALHLEDQKQRSADD